jgi:DNA-directed RNA polymerase specialized sigma24 family protein
MDGSGEVRLPQRHVTELSSFFAAHDRWLFGHAFLRTRGDRELAADLVQDTFEAAARASNPRSRADRRVFAQVREGRDCCP